MSEPTFTPGPWGWCMPDEVFPAVFCNENGNIIADLYDAKNNQRQMVANAALIAAAPDGYEYAETTAEVLRLLLETYKLPEQARKCLQERIDESEKYRKKARGEK